MTSVFSFSYKILQTLVFGAALAFALAPVSAHAFITKSGLPFNASNLVPGASVSGTATLENQTSGALQAQIRATGSSGSASLAEAMRIKISRGVVMLYDDSLDDFLSEGMIPLSSVGAGDSATYTIALSLVGNAPKTLMSTSLNFDFCIGFAGGETVCGSAFPPGPEPSGPGPSGPSPSGPSGPSSPGPSSTSSGGGGSSGGGYLPPAPNPSIGEVLGAQTSAAMCPEYLLSYIRIGGANNPAEVRKLQAFLRDLEGHNLDETGVYDRPTIAAVYAFQKKYSSDVLLPWGTLEPTGYVYYTTRKTINEIRCQFTRAFPLTTQQLDEIARMRESGASFQPTFAPATPESATTTPSPAPAQATQGIITLPIFESQPAAAAQASGGLFQRFKDFFSRLFGR